MLRGQYRDNPERTTAIGLARYAQEFLEASLKADDGMGQGRKNDFVAPVPVLYLAGHSIELSLKSLALPVNPTEKWDDRHP